MDADTVSTLRWQGGGLSFEAQTPRAAFAIAGGPERAAPSPMELLLTGLAGCMAIDVVDILGKMRKAPAAYTVEAQGWRAEKPPRRFTRVRLTHRLAGDVPEAAARRAIELSRSTYCSAMATLDPAVVIENVVVVESVPA